jgi:hypothetical protein
MTTIEQLQREADAAWLLVKAAMNAVDAEYDDHKKKSDALYNAKEEASKKWLELGAKVEKAKLREEILLGITNEQVQP